ncbi:MAG: response regulator [Acidobacteria bacterium]|nr:response regulator [Acidobacteriota bacterium]
MTEAREKRILVVDDEADVNYYLCTALEDAGFRVDSAFSVDEALRTLKEQPPDFVSLDMVMPGKSGIVLFHEMRRNKAWSRIPVLFVTGHAKEEGVRRDLDAASELAQRTMSGPATYLEKPVTAAKYVQAVADILGVSLRTGPAEGEAPAGILRSELHTMIENADPALLAEAMRLLKKGKGPPE